ncbi:MAG: PilX N-terminal domain-containing pilus assembly protein [Caldimonas sp.]
MAHRPRRATRQHGVASLAVVILLFFAMTIVVVFTHRALLTEQRIAENQVRSTQAAEAAEAGLEWAIARLNDAARVDAACLPGDDADVPASFRDRYFPFDVTTRTFVPAVWNDGGTLRPLQAACVRDDSGWTCHCPTGGAPVLAGAASGRTAPAFSLEFAAGARPGIVRVVSTGCTRSSGVCSSTSETAREASVRVEVALALVPGLRAAPAAALTVRGTVSAGNAQLGVHNRDGASGLAVHAGGSVSASALRLGLAAGSSSADSVVANDPGLSGLDDDAFFARYFGMTRAAWSTQPAVVRIACDGPCGAAIAAAVAKGASLIAVEGDLDIDGPLRLGSVERPVVVVASGMARLNGDVAVNGVLFAAGIAWRNAAGPEALIRGAVVSASDYGGDAAADIDYDAAVLEHLQRATGSLARVSGSWKDF